MDADVLIMTSFLIVQNEFIATFLAIKTPDPKLVLLKIEALGWITLTKLQDLDLKNFEILDLIKLFPIPTMK